MSANPLFPSPHNSPDSPTITTPRTQRPLRAQGGFTLLELMLSMMVLAIGITAVIAMQKSALDNHAANRDIQIAGGIADQFLEMLQVDALRWKTALRNGVSYFDGTTYQISNGAAVRWYNYTTAPVNYQMRYVSHDTGTQKVSMGARFCLYFRYQWAGNEGGFTMFQDELIEINTAVLTPRNTDGLVNNNPQCANADTLFQQCHVNLINDNTCSVDARRTLFRRLSRAAMVRRNRSGL